MLIGWDYLLPCKSLPCFGSFRVSVKTGRGTIVYRPHSIVETAIKEWGEEGLMAIMEVEVAPNHFEWNPLFSIVWKGLHGVALLFLSVLGESRFPFASCGMAAPVPSTHRALSGLGPFSHVLPFTSALRDCIFLGQNVTSSGKSPQPSYLN